MFILQDLMTRQGSGILRRGTMVFVGVRLHPYPVLGKLHKIVSVTPATVVYQVGYIGEQILSNFSPHGLCPFRARSLEFHLTERLLETIRLCLNHNPSLRPRIQDVYDIIKRLYSRVRASSTYKPTETESNFTSKKSEMRKKRKIRTAAQKKNMNIDKLLERQQQRALYHYIHYFSMDSEFPPFPREGEDRDEERI
ncbi:hypothetical protein Pmani_014962 [Petrolisthes manimaculis]|uniref:Protein kinase domain-containing protein n=1 Tax=Petrolisthes manimaculis TaxID=1843537 RepID=A0AAE1PT44_9EUCA|nr:hypothetical protein Pmani_014962 [Petrolisthes manimaculis]